jgi:hypothetical protein
MSSKITAEHLARSAMVYVRQSTMTQVLGNTESQRRQYGLVDQARSVGFTTVEVIDEDLGRSGSGVMERPGFQRPGCLRLRRFSRGGVLHRGFSPRP